MGRYIYIAEGWRHWLSSNRNILVMESKTLKIMATDDHCCCESTKKVYCRKTKSVKTHVYNCVRVCLYNITETMFCVVFILD